jgi:hypothetical protein
VSLIVTGEDQRITLTGIAQTGHLSATWDQLSFAEGGC